MELSETADGDSPENPSRIRSPRKIQFPFSQLPPLFCIMALEHSLTQKAARRIWFGILAILAALPGTLGLRAAETRPNILWITFEDTSNLMGADGDPLAVTPNFDRFAKENIRFSRAYAYTGVCAPSRSTLITGVYPTHLGSHHMRSNVPLPAAVKLFPEYLREAGYYATNNVKEDYNFTTPKTAWDESSTKAHWRGRKPGQPFFAVFNHMITHQSQAFARDVEAAEKGLPPPPTVHDQAKMVIPPIHPDIPEFRREWARYYDNITTMDGQAAAILKQLQDDGLAEDTIVFWFADNGTGLPAIKGWAWHKGLNVPCLVHFPKKWEHLRNSIPNGTTDRMISFIDFAPTVLSLAGVKIPPQMQGTAFLGPQAGAPRKLAFGGKERHSERYDMIRYVHDGKMHYLRNFLPHLPWGQYLSYNYQHASLRHWQQLQDEGKLTGMSARFFQTKPIEELYDTSVDPWEINNLATDPRYAADLKRLRGELESWMISNGDLGLLPELEIYRRAGAKTPYDISQDPAKNPVRELLAAARTANERDPKRVPELIKLLGHSDAAFRWWGATGLVALNEKAAPAAAALAQAAKDASPDVRIAVAEALGHVGGVDAALTMLEAEMQHPAALIRLSALNAIDRMGPKAKRLAPLLIKAKMPESVQKDAEDYVERMIEYMPARLGVK